MSYSVGEVARLAGVTVRTLHHYDQVGLLVPTGRSASGYRQYSDTDLQRLQQILSYRELGFGLDDVAALLDGDSSIVDDLRRQHRLLLDRIARLQRIAAALEKTMEAHAMGISLTPEEMLEVFGDDDPTQYADEAAERWGDTDAYQQSRRRVASYTKDDWLRLKKEGATIEQRLRAALADGAAPNSAEAMDSAEAHRVHIDRWFYDCTHDMHRGLADMYLADPRFTAYYEQQAPGLAQYVADAIHANAGRAAQ